MGNCLINSKVDPSGHENDDEDDDGRDPGALSGGEKSFSQICLLLALWEDSRSPFRALDEFDVFMDAVNRRLAMKLLIDYARGHSNSSQFILITPQNTK